MRGKKLFALILALLLLPVWCGAAEEGNSIKIDDIMAANTMEAVLSRHNNAALHIITDSGTILVYADREIRYQCYLQKVGASTAGDTELLMTSEHSAYWIIGRYQGQTYDLFYYMANVGLSYDHVYTPDNPQTATLAYDPEATGLETVTDVEEKDGALIVTTFVTGEDLKTIDDSYPADAKYIVHYTLDPGTLEILGTEEYLEAADGTRSHQAEQKLLYDVGKTDDVSSMEEALEYFLTEKPQRMVTFVVDPGTEQERTYQVTGCQGVPVMYWDDSDNYEAYADPLGEKEAEDDLVSDITFYLINPFNTGVAL